MKGMVEYLLTCIEEVENEIEQDLLNATSTENKNEEDDINIQNIV